MALGAGKLTAAEPLAIVIGRTGVTFVVGVSSPAFAAITELSLDAMAAGAAGVMVAPPAVLRTDAQITGHCPDAAHALGDAPFALPDLPRVTEVQIPTPVMVKIVNARPTCLRPKH